MYLSSSRFNHELNNCSVYQIEINIKYLIFFNYLLNSLMTFPISLKISRSPNSYFRTIEHCSDTHWTTSNMLRTNERIERTSYIATTCYVCLGFLRNHSLILILEFRYTLTRLDRQMRILKIQSFVRCIRKATKFSE